MIKLHTIFNDIWSCSRESFDALAAVALSAFRNGHPETVHATLGITEPKAVGIHALTGERLNNDLEDETAPGTVAYINLHSFLFPETYAWLIDEIAFVENDPNIIGVVLDINGPGGCVTMVDQAADAIRNCSKPVATVVTGYMASAHFWIGTAAHRTFVASPLCRVGCVGVMQSYLSLKHYFEKNGIIEKDIYPDTADLKNHEARELDNGNEEPTKALLAKYHAAFNQSVGRHLGIEVDETLPLFRGEMFMGDEAVKLKYIDAMGTPEDAVKWVLARATSNQANRLFT